MIKMVVYAPKNGIIGSGHFMRCSSIVDAMKRYTTDIIFCEEPDIPECDLLLADNYFITPESFSIWRQSARIIAYIDDLWAFPYDCDLLINYVFCANEKIYEKLYQGITPKLLIRAIYAPLRSQFNSLSPFNINIEAKDILIACGQSDYGRAMSRKISDIVSSKGYTAHILLNITNVAELMSSCDIAISASGTTLFELNAVGLPTIGFVLADNQIVNHEEFAKRGLIYSIGDCREDEGTFLTRLESALDFLSCDVEFRRNMSKIMQKKIDGKGANRIAKELFKYVEAN